MNRFSGFKVYWDRPTNHQTEKQKKNYLQGVSKIPIYRVSQKELCIRSIEFYGEQFSS